MSEEEAYLKIVLKIAQALRSDYESVGTYWQDELKNSIIDILEAAGYFEIVEAAKEMMKCRALFAFIPAKSVSKMNDALRKAGVCDDHRSNE